MPLSARYCPEAGRPRISRTGQNRIFDSKPITFGLLSQFLGEEMPEELRAMTSRFRKLRLGI